MKVPFTWLQEYVPVEESAEEVATRLTMGGLEVEGIEPSALGPVIDVYVTPNRGDCLSMIGVAREIAALYGLPLRLPAPPPSSEGGEIQARTSVTIEEPELCPRYAARMIRGVKVGPTPQWMQDRLRAALSTKEKEWESINNVVDVTNYVLLEMGQPLHAFDFDKLSGQRIVVRQARPGEQIETLDEVMRELSPPMLVIADAEKPVAIAGIMGGTNTSISDQTTNVLIESAHFHPLTVRRTRRGANFVKVSDAAYRFERVVDPGGVRRALDRACELLTAMGQPDAVPGVIDIYPHPIPERKVRLRVQRAIDRLGMELTSHICADALRALGFGVHTDSVGAEDTLLVNVPSFRSDILIEEDLIEEVGRIYGYENIPETLPKGDTTQGGESEEGRFLNRLKGILVGCGLQEVITHSLTAPAFFDPPEDAVRRVAIRNASSANVSTLRRSLLPTLLDVAQHNAARGQERLAIFEVGRIWQNDTHAGEIVPNEYLAVAGLLVGAVAPPGWQATARPQIADYTMLKGVVDHLLHGLDIPEATLRPLEERASHIPQFHPGRTATISLQGGRPDGILGELHPQVASRIDLRNRIYLFEISIDALRRATPQEGKRYRLLSNNQYIIRDLAPRIAEDLPYAAVQAAIQAANVEILEEYRLIDLYRGSPLPENVKSLTLSFTFAFKPYWKEVEGKNTVIDRPLTEQEVNAALTSIRSELEARCRATFPA